MSSSYIYLLSCCQLSCFDKYKHMHTQTHMMSQSVDTFIKLCYLPQVRNLLTIMQFRHVLLSLSIPMAPLIILVFHVVGVLYQEIYMICLPINEHIEGYHGPLMGSDLWVYHVYIWLLMVHHVLLFISAHESNMWNAKLCFCFFLQTRLPCMYCYWSITSL